MSKIRRSLSGGGPLAPCPQSAFSLIESVSGLPELPTSVWKTIPLKWGKQGIKSPLGDRRSGFSLIEIVVAMGILTFALVGLLALFPVALETAAESKAETRITQIAQSVYADIKASPLSSATLVGGPDLESDLLGPVDFSVTTTVYLGYRGDGQCVGVLALADYINGVSGKGDYLVKITSTPVTPATVPPLSTITLSIESPSAAPQDKRQKVAFVTMKGEL